MAQTTNQLLRIFEEVMAEVKIRYREVVATKPTYGRFGEYQVVQGRKIIYRADMRVQAERWCAENNHKIAA